MPSLEAVRDRFQTKFWYGQLKFALDNLGAKVRLALSNLYDSTTSAGKRAWQRQAIISVLLLVVGFCDSAISGAQRLSDELRVLFIGNSLTYTNDLPAIVAALAEATKQKRFIHQSIAYPDFSLEDHWHQGEARKTIAKGRWDFVILQQGPSALPESRVLLLEYARRFAAEIRSRGAQPALYMVWPSAARFGDFDRVSESYRLAAEEVKGALFPAGEAWRAARRRDTNLQLYSSDGLHPSQAGSYIAALVIYEQIFGQSPVGLPSSLQIRSKAISKIEIPTAQADLLQQAAAEANAKFVKK